MSRTPPLFGHRKALSGEIVRAPDRRLRLITLLVTLPLFAVFIRVAEIDASGPQFLIDTGPVRSILERIPARDGRIISSDGQVLAEDVETFSILVHFRWIEQPPDPRWLRGEALRSLPTSERRNEEAVLAAERSVLARREELWNELARVTNRRQDVLRETCAEIQRRIATLRHHVIETRRKDQLASSGERSPAAATWWQAAAQNVWQALTTPPQPEAAEPLILAEELDYHEVADGLPISVAATIESDAERFPGTRIQVESRRHYPRGTVAAHLVGYRFQRDEERDLDGSGATAGQTGIERTYDRHLCGVDGLRRTWVNRRGEAVKSEIVREPRVGRDVVLHLNLELQMELERLLDSAVAAFHASENADAAVPASAGGCIAVIDVRTGGILGAASAPRFDLGQAANHEREFWRNILVDERKPLFDRVSSAAVPPGSIFKIVSAAAFLASGRVDPDEPFECVGYLSRPERHRDYIFKHFGVGHGPTTLTRAIAESCNVYFFDRARAIGAAPLIDWADRLGFGTATGADLTAEADGNVPAEAVRTDVLGLSIGQADLTATPLQIVRMVAAIANGGRLVTPHAVRGTGPIRQGEDQVRPLLRATPVPELRSDILGRLREGLEQVVSHPQGTGYRTVRHSDVKIAGKTGTAEVGGGLADHAWFAGYAPADDPQVAFVVLLEHAGSGGEAAGPVARKIVDALLNRGLIRR